MKNCLIRKDWVAAAGLVLILGCSSQPRQSIEPVSPNAEPSDEISQLEAEIEQGRISQIDTLSPGHYESAQRNLAEAKEIKKKGGEISKIFEKVGEGKAHMKRARGTSELTRDSLQDVLGARENAIKAGALEYETDFNKADEGLREIAGDIEEEKFEDAAEGSPEVREMYNELAVRAVKENRLSQAMNLLDQAKESDADKLAPKTFKITQESFRDAESYVEAHPDDYYGIQSRIETAEKNAKNLHQVAEHSAWVNGHSPEEVTLWTQSQFERMGQKLDLADLRYEPFEVQANRIVSSIGSTSGASRSISSERDTQRKFQELQSSFSPDEADVVQRENQILIRLKSLDFPVGQTEIPAGKYALLGKVQEAISMFSPKKVKVEGHADSFSEKKQARGLSEERAKNVARYLSSSGALDGERISSVGMGTKKPLSRGREIAQQAQNRRVDVVLVLEQGK